MTLVRYRPARDLLNFRDETNRLFDGLTRDFPVKGERFGTYVPDVDVRETDDEILVNVEIPGMDEKNLKVSVRENVLTLKGEKKQEEEKEGTTCRINERCYGQFERSFTLPTNIKTDAITAHYKNGVLAVTLPKAEEVKPREITVKVA